MAQNLIRTIICNDSSPTLYTAGDIIEVFYNDSTEVIEVEVNGSPVTNGEDIYEEYFDTGEFSITNTGYAFCDGAYLQEFPYPDTFPYAFRASSFDEACNANVCDLTKGTALVTPATGVSAADGTITVSATSSYTIKYGLSNFDYNTEGQSSGSFTVFPGSYTVYAKDANGCVVTWSVVVTFDNTSTYGVLQYWTYYNKYDTLFKVELLERGYSGSSTERDFLDGTPVMRRVRGENNTRLDTIFPGEIDVFVKSETDKEYLELMKEGDDKKYLIKYYYDPGGGYELIFQGYVTSSQYTEPYEPSVYTATLHATDRLADLKYQDFSDDSGGAVYGDLKVLDIIRLCLNKTNLGFGYRVGMNLYETNHDATAADDPLDQTYINSDSFYNDNEPLDCYTVLEQVLKSINCKILSSRGFWYIIYKPEEYTTYAYREFNSGGVYQSNTTLNPVVSFKQIDGSDRVTWLTGGKTLQLEPIYKKITVISNRKVRESIVAPFSERTRNGINYIGWSKVLNGESGTFEPLIARDKRYGGNGYYFYFKFVDNQGGDSYVVATGDIEYKGIDTFTLKIPVFLSFLYNAFPSYPPFARFKFRLKVGSKYYDGSQNWSSSETDFSIFLTGINQFNEIELTANFDTSVSTNTSTTFELRIYDIDIFENNLTAATIPDLYTAVGAISTSGYENGEWLVGKVSSVGTMLYWQVITNSSGVKVFDFKGIWNITLSQPDDNSFFPLYSSVILLTFPGGSEINETEELSIKTDRNNVVNLDYEVDHFDLDTSINNTEQLIANYFKLSDGTPTSAWGSSNKKIQRIIGEEISKWYNTAGYRIRGGVTTDTVLMPYNVFKEVSDDNRVYAPMSMEIDDKHMTANLELVELQSDSTVTPSAFTSGFEQDAFL